MRRRIGSHLARLVPILLLMVSLFGLPSFPKLQAQIGGTIGYGSSVYGSITAAGQSLTYSFNGSAGDLVQAAIRHWTGTLDPRLDLTAPDGQISASSGIHPFSDDALSASLSLYLTQTGIYSLRISGESSTSGDFILRLEGRSAISPAPLVFGQPLDVTILDTSMPQSFAFETQDCPTAFIVTNLSEGLPFTFRFSAHVFNSAGTQIAQLYGGDAVEDRLILQPDSGQFEVIVSSDDPQTQGTIQLLVTCLDQAPACMGSGQAAAGADATNVCLPCFADADECAALDVTYILDGLTATFSWGDVEGADWYIFSILDVSGSLLADSPRMVETPGNTYAFNPADLHRAPFTVIVTAGSEDPASTIDCIDEVTIPFDGMTSETCAGISAGVDVIPGEARAAVAHWSAVAGAQAYLIHVYAVDGDGLIGIRVLTVPGDATTYHLNDVFPPDYEQYEIRVAAYSEATGGGAFGDMPQGFLCDGSTRVEFEPLGPVHWGGE